MIVYFAVPGLRFCDIHVISADVHVFDIMLYIFNACFSYIEQTKRKPRTLSTQTVTISKKG